MQILSNPISALNVGE